MRHSLLIASLLAVSLVACSRNEGITLSDQLRNPLFAERYAETVVDRLVEFEIQKDPIIADENKKSIMDSERKKWLEIARDAREKEHNGTTGNWIPLKEFAKGDILYVDDALYFGTLFEIDPLPTLHVYMTTVVDPRDSAFPDPTAIDIGSLKSAYGAQSYTVPHQDNPALLRTVVLWDKSIGVLHSFAQLAK